MGNAKWLDRHITKVDGKSALYRYRWSVIGPDGKVLGHGSTPTKAQAAREVTAVIGRARRSGIVIGPEAKP